MRRTLAATGGRPVWSSRDWPIWPQAEEGTVARLRRTLRSGLWTFSGARRPGLSQEQQFAERFAAYNGVKHCVPTVNGTAALMLALQALGVGAGDEVLVPGLTWVSCATAVTDINAVPVLVDVDRESLCICPIEALKAITPRTRAILAVHLFCSMADMDAFRDLGERTGVPIVEDCAQSHGSKWGNAFAGSLGEIGMFSMHQGKPLTCGEGGAAITHDDRLAARMEQLRNNGRRHPDSSLWVGQGGREQAGEIQGTNAVLSEFHAALLLDGLERLDEQVELRQQNARYLDVRLREIPGVIPVRRPDQVSRQSYYHDLFRVRPECFAGRSAKAVGQALKAELGFSFASPYPPLNRHPLYAPWTNRRYAISDEHLERLDLRRYELPNAEAAHRECLMFRHSILLGTRRQMDAIVEAVEKVQSLAEQIPAITGEGRS